MMILRVHKSLRGLTWRCSTKNAACESNTNPKRCQALGKLSTKQVYLYTAQQQHG